MQNHLANLVENVVAAREWVKDSEFPLNPITRKLRSSDFIEHNGQNLKNAHRSEDQLCDTVSGLIATRGYRQVLEIGTLFGYSTLHFAEAVALNGGGVTTIDMRVKSRKWITGEIVENIHEFAISSARESGLESVITFISGRSDVAMPNLTIEKRQFDLIFIDGSHSKHIVTLDLINAFNLLSEDGLIILDDISENVALREYNHGGPNTVLMHLIGSFTHVLLPLSYNTLIVKPIST